MLADRGCAERGCACYDSRIDGIGVEMVVRQWVGLTDEGALHLWAGDVPRPVMGKNKVLAFARAIEQALKEKNT